jgi:ribulose-5-phosphate 4-epimerase/fuculose-1-phosphate aldolase
MHTHSLNGMAVSAQRDGLLPISQFAFSVLHSLSYHGYEGLALNEEEKPRLVADLGQNNFLMLRNHGLLTIGSSVAEAFQAMHRLEAACMVQVRALAGGKELIPIPEPILAGARQQLQAVRLGKGASLTWPGLLRRLDRVNPGFDA